MDDSTDGLDAHPIADSASSERIEFSSDAIAYADAIWSEHISKSARSPSAPVSRARSRARPASSKRPKDGAPDITDVIVGSSRCAQELREKIALYAREEAPVMISGETGVGKELVAQQLHLLGMRQRGPFVPLNIGAVPETLSASELFGHTKGAFTGAAADRDGAFQNADGGTLFLDEIGDTPLSIQAQLLRVLDDGMVTKLGSRTARQVDIRLIAATNVELKGAVCEGRFRRDLYYRMNVLLIDVPPLRERGDDVIEIAQAMIAALPNERHSKKQLTPKAADRLKSYRFPGNARELRNVLTRAVVHADGPKILDDHISFDVEQCVQRNGAAPLGISNAKELVNRFLLIKALNMAGGNVTKAAKLAGRSRGTLHTLKKQINGEDLASAYEEACLQLKALIDA